MGRRVGDSERSSSAQAQSCIPNSPALCTSGLFLSPEKNSKSFLVQHGLLQHCTDTTCTPGAVGFPQLLGVSSWPCAALAQPHSLQHCWGWSSQARLSCWFQAHPGDWTWKRKARACFAYTKTAFESWVIESLRLKKTTKRISSNHPTMPEAWQSFLPRLLDSLWHLMAQSGVERKSESV